eukprot:gene27171-35894_t
MAVVYSGATEKKTVSVTFESQDGDPYRALCKSDGWKLRDQVDDVILGIEAAHYVLRAVTEYYPNAHVYHNVQLQDTCAREGRVYAGEGIRCHCSWSSQSAFSLKPISLQMQGRPSSPAATFPTLLSRATELERWLQAKKVYPASEGKLISTRKPLDCNHLLFNIQRVVPVLAGILLHQVKVDECVARGVLPLYPSGARYAVKLSALLLKLT